MLNCVFLEPGEVGKPHAYISGVCIEGMAKSDNVIRAGLTPKLGNTPNPVSTFVYMSATPAAHVVDAWPLNSGVSTLYDPCLLTFSIVQVRLYRGDKEQRAALRGPSIPIVIQGKADVVWGESDMLGVGLGDALFVGANTLITFLNAQRHSLTMIW